MRCGKCSADLTAEQRFCRNCGQENPIATDWPMWNGLQVGFAVLMLGTVIGVIGKMGLQSDLVKMAGVLVALGGIAWMMFAAMSSSRQRRHVPRVTEETPLKAATTTRLIRPGEPTVPVSVVDGTTELLKEPRK